MEPFPAIQQRTMDTRLVLYRMMKLEFLQKLSASAMDPEPELCQSSVKMEHSTQVMRLKPVQ